MAEVDMKNAILDVLKGRIASGAGGAGTGGALYDHNVYGKPVQMGLGAPAGAAKKRAPRKKKVESEVAEVVSQIASDVLSGGATGAAKKKRAPRKKKESVEMGESNTSVLYPVSNQEAPPTGAAKRVRGANKWIDHVKAVQKEKGISYTEALKVAAKTYKK